MSETLPAITADVSVNPWKLGAPGIENNSRSTRFDAFWQADRRSKPMRNSVTAIEMLARDEARNPFVPPRFPAQSARLGTTQK